MRGGPSTGIPTKSEQGDLNIATLQQKIETETTQLGQARNAQAQAGPIPSVLGG